MSDQGSGPWLPAKSTDKLTPRNRCGIMVVALKLNRGSSRWIPPRQLAGA
jgi:hypothetical protein